MYRSIAVIALGTRGDVQPLSLLSWQVQQELGDDGQVTLITHAAHQVGPTAVATAVQTLCYNLTFRFIRCLEVLRKSWVVWSVTWPVQ